MNSYTNWEWEDRKPEAIPRFQIDRQTSPSSEQLVVADQDHVPCAVAYVETRNGNHTFPPVAAVASRKPRRTKPKTKPQGKRKSIAGWMDQDDDDDDTTDDENENENIHPSFAAPKGGIGTQSGPSCRFYKQRSTKSLLEDDDDSEIYRQSQFLEGLHGAKIPACGNNNGDKDDHNDENTCCNNSKESHPDLKTVLEVFPEANRERILSLLRQESLTTTLLVLGEESMRQPSDEVALPPELKDTTTYAQAIDEDRDVILSYLIEMFPNIARQEIEVVLMQHSTHQSVSILSERGQTLETLKPPPCPNDSVGKSRISNGKRTITSPSPFHIWEANHIHRQNIMDQKPFVSRSSCSTHTKPKTRRRLQRSPIDVDDNDLQPVYPSRNE